jgi:hypothetical protein
MPFKSKAQRRWMYANDPEMAKRWEDETPKGKKLPEKLKGKKKKNHGGPHEPGIYLGGPQFGSAPNSFWNVPQGLPPEVEYQRDQAFGNPMDVWHPPDLSQMGNGTSYFQTEGGTGYNPMESTNQAKAEEYSGTNPIKYPGQNPPPVSEVEKQPGWNPYLMLRGMTTAGTFFSNLMERNRQKEYEQRQQALLNSRDPMPYGSFQPNTQNLYMKKGGVKLRKGGKYGGTRS